MATDVFLKGVVEGFYGKPWTFADRMDMVEFLGEHGFNIYIYAPKDDPYHRGKWRDHYPQETLRRIGNLVHKCDESGVKFCFAISPGLSMRYSNEEDYKSVLKKIGSIWELGARDFGLFLDDILPELQSEEDKARFASLSEAHCSLANRLYSDLRSKDPAASLILCPTPYWGIEPQEYHRTFAEKLSKAIKVMWTGRYVCSPVITSEEAKRFGSGIGNKPFLWDNYPVNDYNRHRLNLGPLRGRSPDLPDHLSGFVSNPMNEPEASKIALITVSDYLNDARGYDPERSWEKAIMEVGGARGYKVLRRFAEQSSLSFLLEEETTRQRYLIAELSSGRKGPDSAEGRELERYFKETDSLLPKGLSTIKNADLLREIKPFLPKAQMLSRLGLASVALLRVSSRKRTAGGVGKGRGLLKRTETLKAKIMRDKHQLFGEYALRFSLSGDEAPSQRSYVEELAGASLRAFETFRSS